ncbi:MAG TPA: hypothetical protein VJ924_13730, partial [Alphaproteobacteria bacterium]|nr:hypothetical protein [Alphaproteobacteria bacterium]
MSEGTERGMDIAMNVETLTEDVRRRVGDDNGAVKKTIKITFNGGEGVIYIDGAATPNAVHNQDLACDLNIIVGLDDFKRIMAREASGLKLMLAGKMR